jgi:hypothetical protein
MRLFRFILHFIISIVSSCRVYPKHLVIDKSEENPRLRSFKILNNHIPLCPASRDDKSVKRESRQILF